MIKDQDIPRPNRMANPGTGRYDKGSSVVKRYGLYLQDEARDIFVDKYGIPKGEQYWEDIINGRFPNAMFTVASQIVAEKQNLIDILKKPQPKDYWQYSYIELWNEWMSKGGKKMINTESMKLNPIESQVVETILKEDKKKVDSILELSNSYAKVLNLKSRKYINECVTHTRAKLGNGNFEQATIAAFELREQVRKLLKEEKNSLKRDIKDNNHLKNISIEAPDSDTPATIYLTFNIVTYPDLGGWDEQKEMLRLLNLDIRKFGVGVFQMLRRSARESFPHLRGTGIWDITRLNKTARTTKYRADRSGGNATPISATIECALDTTIDTKRKEGEDNLAYQKRMQMGFLEAVADVEKFVTLIDVALEKDENLNDILNPENQTIGTTKGGSTEPVEDDDEVGTDDWYKPETEFDIPEEPTKAELKNIEKGIKKGQLAEGLKTALLKEKLQKVTGKKVILK